MKEHIIGPSGTQIHMAEEILYPADWWFSSHTHEDCYQMFFVRTKELSLEIGDSLLTAKENQAFIVPPGVPHAMPQQGNTHAPLVIEMMFSLDCDDFITGLQRRGYLVSLDEMAVSCIRQATALASSRQPVMQNRAKCFFEAALAQLSTFEEDLDPLTLNGQFIDMDDFSEVTKSVIVYIDKNYQNAFTLESMGAELGYSKSYLCTVFKHDTNSTINDYLNFIRISHFAQYYSFMDADISFIALHCGFQSTSHFNRTFKKFVGMSPRSFKQVRSLHFNSAMIDKTNSNVYEKLEGILGRVSPPARKQSTKTHSKKQVQN